MNKKNLMTYGFALLTTALVKPAVADAQIKHLSPKFEAVFGHFSDSAKMGTNPNHTTFVDQAVGKDGYIEITAEQGKSPNIIEPEDVKELKVFKRDGEYVTMTSMTKKGKDNWSVLVAEAHNRNGTGKIDLSVYREEDWKHTGNVVLEGNWMNTPGLKLDAQ